MQTCETKKKVKNNFLSRVSEIGLKPWLNVSSCQLMATPDCCRQPSLKFVQNCILHILKCQNHSTEIWVDFTLCLEIDHTTERKYPLHLKFQRLMVKYEDKKANKTKTRWLICNQRSRTCQFLIHYVFFLRLETKNVDDVATLSMSL